MLLFSEKQSFLTEVGSFQAGQISTPTSLSCHSDTRCTLKTLFKFGNDFSKKSYTYILLILNHQKLYFTDAKTFFRVVGRLDYIAGYNIVSPPLNLSIFCHPARNFIRSTICSKSIVCATIYEV